MGLLRKYTLTNAITILWHDILRCDLNEFVKIFTSNGNFTYTNSVLSHKSGLYYRDYITKWGIDKFAQEIGL